MARSKKSHHSHLDSPESRIAPYEDFNTRQKRITGEKFPILGLGICDKCGWCYSLMNERGRIKICKVCEGNVSSVPMNIDEICTIEEDEKRGLTIRFDRKPPLR